MDPLAPPPQIALPGLPQVGDVVAEKYRIEGVLGVGGMGVVVGARHLTLGQSVAIKILTAGETQPKDAVERFLREGRAAAALSSDHVVRIYDVGQLDNGVPFMVMERLRGGDLANLLTERGPLPVEEAVEYVAQATMAIAEAHEAGVVHRDLKPANLFLTQRSDGSPCVKVLDFGISKQLSMFESATLRGDLTSTRQVMGSPAYMSPEQVRDARSVDHRTDIWALGTTLYELLTHHVAFDADTLPAVCAAIAADPPTPIELHRGDVPEGVAQIVMRCLEKSPDKRYQSARALLSALRAHQGRPDALVVSARDEGPATAASVPPKPRLAESASGSSAQIRESGERARGSVKFSDSQDSTLMSGRGTTGLSAVARSIPAPDDHAGPLLQTHSRRRWSAIGAGLGLIGAVTFVWLLRPFERPNPESRQAAVASTTPAKVEYTLRIESDPPTATVFEGARWLGETPLELPIESARPAVKVRQFIVKKSGYVDATLRQAGLSSDRQVQVTLTRQAGPEVLPASLQQEAAPAPRPTTAPLNPTPRNPTRASQAPKASGDGLHSRGVNSPNSMGTGQSSSVGDIRINR